ncbi:MAG: hypothetical protein LBK70_03485 [Clostridiales bacterium]|jgi:transposase-like protein|nr:hypothetical protein [Clostridiales bacterium]
MECLKCHCQHIIKNGTKHGKQYYKCSNCSVQFSSHSRINQDLKLYTIVLYCYGLSLRVIGQLIGYSNVSIFNWIKEYTNAHSQSKITRDHLIDILSQMSDFLHSKKWEVFNNCNSSINCQNCTVVVCSQHLLGSKCDLSNCDDNCIHELLKHNYCQNCTMRYCRQHNYWYQLLHKIDNIIAGKADLNIPSILQNIFVG